MEEEKITRDYLAQIELNKKEMILVAEMFRSRLVDVLGRLPQFAEAVTRSFLEEGEEIRDNGVGFELGQYWYEVNMFKKGGKLSVFRCMTGEKGAIGALSSGFSLNNTGEIFYLEVVSGEWDPRKKEWDREAVPFVELMIEEIEASLL